MNFSKNRASSTGSSYQAKKLIIDIETAGDDFDTYDKTTKDVLTTYIRNTAKSDKELEEGIAEVKNNLVFSPLTAQIVAIGVLDHHQSKGVVYYQTKGKEKESVEGDITYKPMSEKDMLQAFWEGAQSYQHFITFNGRGFDIPFINMRSAINGIRPTKDLMRGRYLYQQTPDAIHIDLFDQLNYYGALRRSGAMHMYMRAFNLKSPKDNGVKGEDVTALFKEGRYLDIARYNADDLFATQALYDKWDKFLRF
ncbi:MAG: ribonuclease H-like domain-containing protein [Candidatus Paceibacterota bacterium]